MSITVTIIGANSLLAIGLIGDLLSKDYHVKAADYSDLPLDLQNHQLNSSKLTWTKLSKDDFNLFKELLNNSDTVFYFPHQSATTQRFSRINQLNFLLLQTHWIANIAKSSRIKKIIYLSSLMEKENSRASLFYNRFEIENILKDSNIPTIVLRIPLLLMNGDDNFEFIKKMLKIAPVLFLPTWVEKQVQPIYWKDVVEILIQLQLDHSYTKIHRNINLPGPTLLSYSSFFKLVMKKFKWKCSIFISNFFPQSIMRFFLSLFTSYSSFEIQKKMISWNQDAVVLGSDWKQKKTWVDCEDALKYITREAMIKPPFPDHQFLESIFIFKTGNISTLKAHELALEFFYWLQNFFLNIIRVEIKEKSWKIFFPQKLILLRNFELQKSTPEEVIFKCDCTFFGMADNRLFFKINISQARYRRFAFFSFESNEKLNIFRKLFIVFIMKRFLKFLSLG
jgi:hypothetical protein